MDLLKGNIKKAYIQYLIPSMGSTIVMTIYSFVDTIAVGQSVGPGGAAALAVIMPLFGLTAFLGIICGIGGSVMMSKARGKGNNEKGNAYFTVSLVIAGVFTAVAWLALALFAEKIFAVFGASADLMPLVMEYGKWMIIFCPAFILSAFLACFIRNDNAPKLAMTAVVIGGIINIFGDWLFVFPLGMGITGAAIATALGTSIQTLILCSHFFTKKCGLKLVKPYCISRAVSRIISTGFGAGLIDISVVVLTGILNNQVIRYGGEAALAVFGVVLTIVALIQALFGGVGNAIQPIVSTNFGAGENERIRQVFRMSIVTVVLMGLLFTTVGLLLPTQIIRLFMKATPEVLEIAPSIVRTYFLSLLPMGISILAIYYMQSIMHTKISIGIALSRGLIISGLLVSFLPLVAGLNGVWWAIVITECAVAIAALCCFKSVHRQSALKPN